MDKSKYYYDYKRNIDESAHETASETASETAKTAETASETVGQRIPDYYIGSVYGYEARKVIEDWDLSYNVGTATTYLLRCGKKKELGMTDKYKHIEDINKAINHLKFEIERLENK